MPADCVPPEEIAAKLKIIDSNDSRFNFLDVTVLNDHIVDYYVRTKCLPFRPLLLYNHDLVYDYHLLARNFSKCETTRRQPKSSNAVIRIQSRVIYPDTTDQRLV